MLDVLLLLRLLLTPPQSRSPFEMFKPTLALLSKASRAPLTSKGGNKEFYKGTSPSLFYVPPLPPDISSTPRRNWILPGPGAEASRTTRREVQGALHPHARAHADVRSSGGTERIRGPSTLSLPILVPIPVFSPPGAPEPQREFPRADSPNPSRLQITSGNNSSFPTSHEQ